MLKITKSLLTPIIVIGVSLLSSACMTPSTQKVAESMIKECDDSGDRLVSKTEALACGATQREFEQTDLNSDGYIDHAELRAMAPNR